MSIPLLDLSAQYETIREQMRAAVDRVLDSQQFIYGPELTGLEAELADYLGCAHAIGVSSGSDALLAALMALDIGPGDEVITTPYTFFATAGAVHRVGARPVFVDIDMESFNIDVNAAIDALSPRTRAIIPVHLFGRCADITPLLDVCRERDIPVIEDAAQAIGADLDGRAAGTMGELGCFSFFPSKNLGCAGDGGLVTSNDDALADRVRLIRGHGARPKYIHRMVGANFRLDALQAAILRVKLPHLDDWNRGRLAAAGRYRELFDDVGLVAKSGPVFATPSMDAPGRQVFHQYVIRADRRDDLREHLQAQGISTAVYYPTCLHLQECFAYLGYQPGDLTVAERAAREAVALPIYPELRPDQQRVIVEAIAAFYRMGSDA